MNKESNHTGKPSKLENGKSLPDEVKAMISKLPKDDQKTLVGFISAKSITHHSGPLPPPSQLAEYEKIIPNGAERIMLMAEKQMNHRIAMEGHSAHESFKYAKRGQKFGFIIGLTALIAAIALALMDHEEIAKTVIITEVAILAAAFVTGKIVSLINKDS